MTTFTVIESVSVRSLTVRDVVIVATPSARPVNTPSYTRAMLINRKDIYEGRVIKVSDDVAAQHTRALARYEGHLVGISAGANTAAAIEVAKSLGKGAVVLTVFSDTGERYLTTDLFSGGV